MSEWDFNETDVSDDFSTQRQGNKRKNDYVGSLNTGMTICCFLSYCLADERHCQELLGYGIDVRCSICRIDGICNAG